MTGPTGVNRRKESGVFSSLSNIVSASYLKAGTVVKDFENKLDYYISETREDNGVPINGTSPQLYANPQQITPGTGEPNTASNIGDGEGLFAQKVAFDLQFRSQVSQYGLESHLVGDTYYRGLNPFVAESIGSFFGDMVTSRTTSSAIFNRSGVIKDVKKETTGYGSKGLSCFPRTSVKTRYTKDLNNPEWQIEANWTKSAGSEDPSLPGVSTISIDTNGVIGMVKQTFSSQGAKLNGGFRVKGISGETIKVELRASDASVVQQVLHTFSGDWEFLTCTTASDTPWSSQTSNSAFLALRKDPPATASVFEVSAGICYTVHQTNVSIDDFPLITTSGAGEVIAQETTVIPIDGNMPKQGSSWFFVLDTNFNNEFRPQTCIQIGKGVGRKILLRGDLNNVIPSVGDGVSQIVGDGFRKNSDNLRIVFRYDSSSKEFQIFKNGQPVGSPTSVNSVVYDLDENIYIGSSDLSTEHMKGYVKIVKWGVNQSPSNSKILEWGGYGDVI